MTTTTGLATATPTLAQRALADLRRARWQRTRKWLEEAYGMPVEELVARLRAALDEFERAEWRRRAELKKLGTQLWRR